MLCRDLGYTEASEPHFWHYVPRGVVYRYASKKVVPEAKKLARQKQVSSSMWYAYDVLRNPMRLFYLIEHGRRFYKKYKTYCPKQDG